MMLDLERFIDQTDDTEAATPPTQAFANVSSADINQGGRNDAFLRWVILQSVAEDRSLLPDATTVNRAAG